MVLVPVAVTVAIVRHDLFDIDRLLSESTAWMVTLVLSAATFGVVVLGVSEVVSRSSGLQLTAAAFVTALVLLPLHRYVSGAVARVVDRDRFVAVAQVERFAADVRAGRRDPEEIEAVLREAHGDPGLRLVLAEGGLLGRPRGEVSAATDGLTLTFGGDAIAQISSTNDAARAAAGWWHCRARPQSRSRCAGCGSACARAGLASSRRPSPSGGDWSATCTTVPNSA